MTLNAMVKKSMNATGGNSHVILLLPNTTRAQNSELPWLLCQVLDAEIDY
jgi:hypothetical protein